ncbi:MAG: hypothetical protein GXY10_03840, partial [Clostridiales bacterium]|nr:hypothetical protein [Clostridiales bacterium]
TRCTAEMLPVAPLIMYKDGKMTEFRDDPCDWQDAFINSTHDFIDCIKYDRDPILTGEKGREVLKFALAAIDSSKKNSEIFLDSYEDKPVPKKKGVLSIFFKKKK